VKFPDLLISSIQRSEIPLRFEPGAEESVAKPVTELIKVWLEAHRPGADRGEQLLIDRLLEELEGTQEVPE
jgi:hypothetical protein